MSALSEQITREYEREQRENRRAVNPEDIPVSYEAITPEWLTHVLCKGRPGAKVLSCRLDAPDEGGTNRRRIFIDYNAAGKEAGLPGSVFCKASHQLQTRLILAEFGYIQGEVAFYTRYRPLLDIEVPRCLLATYDPRSFNSLLMFDDAVRLGAEFCLHTTVITRARAESQVALLARLHARFHESPELKASTLPGFEDYFANLDRFIGMQGICDSGFLAAEAEIPGRLFRRAAEIWPATMKSVALHGQLPRTFTHGDPHLRNWYIAPDGGMALCDWQNFCGGHWCRDVAYAIASSLTTPDRRAWERDLLRGHLAQLHALGGPALGFDEAWRHYRQHLLTILAWWTSTLTIGTTQPRDATLAIIGRIAAAIDDLDALDSFDD